MTFHCGGAFELYVATSAPDSHWLNAARKGYVTTWQFLKLYYRQPSTICVPERQDCSVQC